MLQHWEMVAFIAYGIPGVSLYFFVFHQLLFRPGFQSAFFKLSIVIGIIDLTDYVTVWFDLKLNLYPPTAFIYPYFPKFIYLLLHFLKYYLSKVRELLIVSTAANRFSAFYWPQKHEKIWQKFFWPSILASFGIPMLTTFHILCGTGYIVEAWDAIAKGEYIIYVIDYSTSWYKPSNAMLSAVHTTVASFLSIAFNLATLRCVLSRKTRLSATQIQTQNAERNLYFIVVSDFTLDLISGINQYVAYYYSVRKMTDDPFFRQLYLLYPWTYDIVCLSRPILLVTVCKQFRDPFLQMFFYKFKRKQNTNTHVFSITVM